MARRQIGQEAFEFAREERGRRAGLDELAGAIDWMALERLLAGIYAAPKGEKGWPPLALLKALLLGFWHDLSDERLAEALDDRASFRRFCGFAASEPTPERTAFVRIRAELVRRKLDAKLLRAVVTQLEAKGLVVKSGTLVDATVVKAASRHDGEAGWNRYTRGGPVKGYKAHMATDEAGGIVRKVAVTSANLHDCRGLAQVLPRRPGRVWADAAYDQVASRASIRAAGGYRAHLLAHRPALAGRRSMPPRRRGTPRSGQCGRASRRSSGLASAATGSGAPATSGLPRCRCRRT